MQQDAEAPPGRRWSRLDHVLQEVRPGDFEVRDRGGRLVGWVTWFGGRFQARGIAARLEDAPTLGTFLAGMAALRLVIGYFDVMTLRQRTIDEARRLEREYEARRRGSSTPAPDRSARTARPDRSERDRSPREPPRSPPSSTPHPPSPAGPASPAKTSAGA